MTDSETLLDPQQHKPPVSPRHHAMHHDASAATLALKAIEEAQVERKEHLQRRRVFYFLAGRLLLASLFLVSGVVKMLNFDQTARALADIGLTDTDLVLAGAIAIELIGGALLFVGYKTRAAAVALIGYVASATVLVLNDLAFGYNATFALANVAFVGGLLMLVAHGSGGLSLDRLFERRRTRRFLA